MNAHICYISSECRVFIYLFIIYLFIYLFIYLLFFCSLIKLKISFRENDFSKGNYYSIIPRKSIIHLFSKTRDHYSIILRQKCLLFLFHYSPSAPDCVSLSVLFMEIVTFGELLFSTPGPLSLWRKHVLKVESRKTKLRTFYNTEIVFIYIQFRTM